MNLLKLFLYLFILALIYFIYDYNQYKLFDIGFDTYNQAFDFCLGKFKTDEEMEDIIILPLRRNGNVQ